MAGFRHSQTGMHEERSNRNEPTPVQRERNTESAILAIALERHPQLLTEAQVIEEMTAIANPTGRTEAVEHAIGELIRVGLLRPHGDLLEPTPALLRVGELEIGL